MDPNAAILIELACLRGISASFCGGDEIRRSLASTIDAIVDTISQSTNVLYDITSYIERERERHEYVDGLDCIATRRLKIIKEHIFALFRDPQNGEIPNTNTPHISIQWCTFHPFVDNWMDIWYMVFDLPPHNNREMRLYFLRNLYAEFMLHRHVNYFSYLEFQGIGGGMPQNRPNARVEDPGLAIPAPQRSFPGPDVPPATRVVVGTRDAFLTLALAVVCHSTTVQLMGDDAGPGHHDTGPSSSSMPSSSAGPSTSAEPSTGAPTSAHPHQNSDPQECTLCGHSCNGLGIDVILSGFFSDLLCYTGSDPLDFPLGHDIPAIDPFGGGVIHDVTDPSYATEIHHWVEGFTRHSMLSRAFMDKGCMYMRRSTPKKTQASHGHGVTEPMSRS